MNPTEQHLVHTTTADLVAEKHSYADGLAFDLYRPRATGPHALVVIVGGYPDPGMTAFVGKPMRQWASYQDWARLVAATGIACVLYENREPADVTALLGELRAKSTLLGIDPARIALFACSGHGAFALATFAREAVAAGVFVYPYLLDLPGHGEVASAQTAFRFTNPGVTLEDLPTDRPVLVVKAGADATPGLNASLDRFVEAGRAKGMALTTIDHATGPHSFDLLDPSPRSVEVIDEILGFLRRTLL